MIKEDTKNEFLPYLDFVKAFLMLLVVLYHCIALWRRGGWFNQPPREESLLLQAGAEWLNSFHIYCFTFVSGYIFCFQKCENRLPVNFFSFFVKKAKRLLLPYAIVSVCWAAPIYKCLYRCSWMDLCRNFLLAKNPSNLWFLLMLFWLFCFFYFIRMKYIENAYISLPILVILYYLSTVGLKVIPNYFQILMALRYAVFFWLGMYFYLKGLGFINKLSSFSLLIIDIVVFGIWAGVSFYRNFVFLELSTNVVGAVAAFVIFIRLARRLQPILEKFRLSSFLIKNNFYVYLLHQQIIFFVITFLNSRVPSLVLVLCNFVCSMVVSLGIIFLFQRLHALLRIGAKRK